MRIGRALITPAILVLGTAGVILAGSAVPATGAMAPAAHVHVIALSGNSPAIYYHV